MNALILLLLLLALTFDLSIGAFVSDLMIVISKGRYDQNILFSPTSIQQAMGMMFLGARGDAATNLQASFGLGSHTDLDLAAKFSTLYDKDKGKGFTLNVSNRFYVDKDFQLASEVDRLAKKIFHVSAVPVAKNTKITADINSWVKQQTASKLDGIVTDDLVWSERAVLVNNVYFKANWLIPFPKDDTVEYHTDNKGKKTFAMMVRTSVMPFGTLSKLDAYAAILNLKDTDIVLMVLVPKPKSGGLAVLEPKLKDIDLTQLPKTLTNTKVTFKVPRFGFISDVPLKQSLEEIGLKSIFSEPYELLNDYHFIVNFDEIRHRAHLIINEDGIEIAAASGVQVYPPAYAIPKIVDREFFFALMDDKNVYFTGHVTNV